ncbi:stepping stone [Musca autumnalis]|uniref:stepping stone n=1 Tax=Musca autumnalis TaxID=221902 RepID=UPI003CF0584D
MHLKLKTQNHTDSLDSKHKSANRKSKNMASSLVNDDDDNASSTTRSTQQSQSQQPTTSQTNNNNNNTNNGASAANASSTSTSKTLPPNEAKAKKENLQQRKLELEKLLNEKNWLLQQLQKQESEILNGNFEYMNFNDFIQSLNLQYKQEQATTESTITGGSSSIGGGGDEAILRRKPLTAKENQQHHNVLHRRQSEISNRSSEYDNYPHQDNLSTHSEGAASGGGGARGASGGGSATMTMQQAQQAQQQYNAKSALKKRSATVAGTTQQSATNLQMIRQQHQMEQQLIQHHNLYKQHYHHPQQHLFKQHIEHHQVLMPHLQYATQKFYYTTLQPTSNQPSTSSSSSGAQQQQQQQQHHQQVAQQQQKSMQQQLHQQQQQYGRYIKSNQLPQAQAQAQQHHHAQQAQQQSPNHAQQQHHMQYNTQSSPSSSNVNYNQQQLLLTPPGHGATASHMDNISLYSLNSNNVATLHRQAQQQQPIIVQCDKYYLSPTTHHVSQNDGGGFIKSSQNIKEYISPMNSPQHHQQLMGNPARDKRLTSQTNLSNRVNTPSIDAISLAPSYVSMETIDYMTVPISQAQQQQQQTRWKSQTNLPPHQPSATSSSDIKSYSSDMLNNNQYYNSSLQPPPPAAGSTSNQQHPPHVTQVKPFKPLDDISINSGYSTETQKKNKPKQWLESSLDGPVIRQTAHNHPNHNEDNYSTDHNANSNTSHQRSKLSSHSLNTSRHYSMSAAASHSPLAHSAQAAKLSQSTSYLNQMDAAATGQTPVNTTPSISQAYNIEIVSPQTPIAYKFLPVSTGGGGVNTNKPPARPPLYINATAAGTLHTSASPTTGLLSGVAGSSASALSPDIRVESPKNVTVVQPATFQPYKEVTKPFEMSDFYKYSTKYRQKENNNNSQVDN